MDVHLKTSIHMIHRDIVYIVYILKKNVYNELLKILK